MRIWAKQYRMGIAWVRYLGSGKCKGFEMSSALAFDALTYVNVSDRSLCLFNTVLQGKLRCSFHKGINVSYSLPAQ